MPLWRWRRAPAFALIIGARGHRDPRRLLLSREVKFVRKVAGNEPALPLLELGRLPVTDVEAELAARMESAALRGIDGAGHVAG